jgi:hypothetical protein
MYTADIIIATSLLRQYTLYRLQQVWGLCAHPHGHSYVTTGDDGTPAYTLYST